jgi:hypothetical protein
MLNAAKVIGPEQADQLARVIALKMRFAHTGVEGWFEAVASGILANWLVGMPSWRPRLAPSRARSSASSSRSSLSSPSASSTPPRTWATSPPG